MELENEDPSGTPASDTQASDATPPIEGDSSASAPASAETAAPPKPPGVPRWIFVALAVAVLAALFWPRGERISLLRRPDPTDASGAKVALDGRFGRVTLLHFWASWCPPCVSEVPALKRLVRDMPPGGGLSYVLVAVEEEPAKAIAFLGELAPLNVFDREWKVAHSFGTDKLPETYLMIDGRVAEKFIGATDWDDPAIRARLRAALAGPTAR